MEKLQWFEKHPVATKGTQALTALFAVIGLAGMPDDLETWGRALGWLRGDVPWWVFLGASGLLLVLLYVPPFLTRSKTVGSPMIVDADGYLAFADPEAAKVEPTHEPEKSEQQEQAAAQASPPPTESEKVVIDDLRVAYRTIGKDASWQALKILLSIKDSTAGENPLTHLLVHITEPHRKARDKLTFFLRDGSTNSMDEVIGAFGELFHQYMLTVRWMHLAGAETGAEPMALVAFHEWYRRHQAFAQELNRTLQRSRLARLREDIEGIGWHARFRDDPRQFDPDYPNLPSSGPLP